MTEDEMIENTAPRIHKNWPLAIIAFMNYSMLIIAGSSAANEILNLLKAV